MLLCVHFGHNLCFTSNESFFFVVNTISYVCWQFSLLCVKFQVQDKELGLVNKKK